MLAVQFMFTVLSTVPIQADSRYDFVSGSCFLVEGTDPAILNAQTEFVLSGFLTVGFVRDAHPYSEK